MPASRQAAASSKSIRPACASSSPSARRATEADQRIKRLYDVLVAGVADLDDPALKDRSASCGAASGEGV
jgi:hypothetical protein